MFLEPPKNWELPASHVEVSSLLDGFYPLHGEQLRQNCVSEVSEQTVYVP